LNRPKNCQPGLRTRGWLWGLLLVAATLAAYWPCLNGGFVWDDDSWTTGIPGLLRDFSGLRLMWCKPTALQQYYPLTGTTFWLDYQFWGFWTLPYHVENVLLHACAALIFWRLLRRLEVPGAWLAGAVFALHPVMVESAGWITERKNVLSLVFYLGTLLAYGRYTRLWIVDNDPDNSPSRPRGAYALALLLFLAAYLAKATAFSLPAVLLLVCWWKRGRLRWRADVLPALPFFALAIGLGMVPAWVEKHHVGAQGSDWAISFPERGLIAGRALWFYAGKLVWPVNLCFVYPRWHLDANSLWQWFYPAAAAGTLLALWLARKRIGRGPAAAVFFFAGTLFPVLGFMNVYGMRYSFVWDHWVYISSLGLIALGVGLVARAVGRFGAPAALYGFAVVMLPVLGKLTWQQCGMYANVETLWQTTLARNPNSFIAHNNFGKAILQKGQVEEAIAHFQKSLEIRPDNVEAHSNLGNALLQKGQVEEAIAHYQAAIEVQPTNAYILDNLAWLRAANPQARYRDGAEAVRLAEQACQLTDYHAPMIVGTLGAAYAEAGRFDEAVAASEKARELALALGQKDLAEKNQQLIQLFRTRQPYREPAR